MPRTGKRRKRVPWTCLVPDMTAVARGRPSSAGARPPAHTVGCRQPSRCVGHPRRRAIGTWISLTSWEAWGRGSWVAWLAPPALKRQRRVLASVKALPKPGCAANSLGELPKTRHSTLLKLVRAVPPRTTLPHSPLFPPRLIIYTALASQGGLGGFHTFSRVRRSVSWVPKRTRHGHAGRPGRPGPGPVGGGQLDSAARPAEVCSAGQRHAPERGRPSGCGGGPGPGRALVGMRPPAVSCALACGTCSVPRC